MFSCFTWGVLGVVIALHFLIAATGAAHPYTCAPPSPPDPDPDPEPGISLPAAKHNGGGNLAERRVSPSLCAMLRYTRRMPRHTRIRGRRMCLQSPLLWSGA